MFIGAQSMGSVVTTFKKTRRITSYSCIAMEISQYCILFFK